MYPAAGGGDPIREGWATETTSSRGGGRMGTVLGGAGAVLLLGAAAASWRSGFGNLARVLSVATGGLLLVTALGLALMATSAPADVPAAAPSARTLTPEPPGLPAVTGPGRVPDDRAGGGARDGVAPARPAP